MSNNQLSPIESSSDITSTKNIILNEDGITSMDNSNTSSSNTVRSRIRPSLYITEGESYYRVRDRMLEALLGNDNQLTRMQSCEDIDSECERYNYEYMRDTMSRDNGISNDDDGEYHKILSSLNLRDDIEDVSYSQEQRLSRPLYSNIIQEDIEDIEDDESYRRISPRCKDMNITSHNMLSCDTSVESNITNNDIRQLNDIVFSDPNDKKTMTPREALRQNLKKKRESRVKDMWKN